MNIFSPRKKKDIERKKLKIVENYLTIQEFNHFHEPFFLIMISEQLYNHNIVFYFMPTKYITIHINSEIKTCLLYKRCIQIIECVNCTALSSAICETMLATS